MRLRGKSDQKSGQKVDLEKDSLAPLSLSRGSCSWRQKSGVLVQFRMGARGRCHPEWYHMMRCHRIWQDIVKKYDTYWPNSGWGSSCMQEKCDIHDPEIIQHLATLLKKNYCNTLFADKQTGYDLKLWGQFVIDKYKLVLLWIFACYFQARVFNYVTAAKYNLWICRES